jgi:TetR/AcrR family transcriptional regulator
MASQVIQANLHKMARQMKEEEVKGILRPMDPRHLITNIISMCIFPFIARPLIKPMLFEDDPKKYDRFIKEKKAIIKRVILDSIKP